MSTENKLEAPAASDPAVGSSEWLDCVEAIEFWEKSQRQCAKDEAEMKNWWEAAKRHSFADGLAMALEIIKRQTNKQSNNGLGDKKAV